MNDTKVKATKLGTRNWIVIIILGLAGQMAWNIENSWFNTFIFDEITPDPQVIAIMVAVSAIVATVTTLVMGTASDRIGKRKPFIMIGYILWGISTIAFPLSAYAKTIAMAALLVIILDAVMTFFGSTAYDAAYNAWVTDITDETNRGIATGVIMILPVLIGVFMSASGAIIDNFGYNVFFYTVGGIVAVFGLLIGNLVKESDSLKPNTKAANQNFFKHMFSVFRIKTIKKNKLLFLILAVTCTILIAYQVTMAYDMIYLNNYLNMSKTVASLMGLVALPIMLIFSLLFGKLNDKGHGFKLIVLAPAMFSVGVFLFSFSTEIWQLLIARCINIIGLLAIMISSQVHIKNLMPEDQRGQFEGIRMIFMVLLPMVIGPAIGASIIQNFGIATVLNGTAGFIPTPIIYQAAGLVSLLSYIVIYYMAKTMKNNVSKS